MTNHLPPLNALRFFEAVARHKSFKKAAAELFVTPAAVSHQIRCLEESLDTQLFIRLPGAIELSPEGKRFLPEVVECFERLKRAVENIQGIGGEDVLTITAGPAFTSKWLLPKLGNFRNQNKNTDVRIIANLALFDLEKERIDIAIRFGDPQNAVDPILLYEESIVPMCSPEFLNIHSLTIDSIQYDNSFLIHDESLKMVSDKAPDWEKWFASIDKEVHKKNRQGMRFNHADHALQSAMSGNGLLLGRRILADEDLRSGRLVVPFGPELKTGLWFYLCISPRATERAAVRNFQAWITDYFLSKEEELAA